MSGGYFDYNQYMIQEIADEIKQIIYDNGRKKTERELKEESWNDEEYYKKYPEELYHYKYSDEVIKKLKEGIKCLEKSAIYVQRIDYLLSGDDSEKSFLDKLKEEESKTKFNEEV